MENILITSGTAGSIVLGAIIASTLFASAARDVPVLVTAMTGAATSGWTVERVVDRPG